jgi:hypothetical protein
MVEIRKLEKKEDAEKRTRRNTLILSIMMIGILVLSTAGYFTMRDESSSTTGSEKVENVGDAWVLREGEQTMRLSSSPESAENVSILLFRSVNDYAGKTVYVASDNEAQFYEIASTLGRYTERMQPACYGKCEKNLPEKNCNDTMIVIRNLNESNAEFGKRGRIYEESGCVFIEGKMDAIDAFIYKLFGVI